MIVAFDFSHAELFSVAEQEALVEQTRSSLAISHTHAKLLFVANQDGDSLTNMQPGDLTHARQATCHAAS